MTNEYGQILDRNGYAPQIINQGSGCYLCRRTDRALHRHEVYHGANRAKSKALGLWVKVCDLCHAEIHQGGHGTDRELKAEFQAIAAVFYGWSDEEFRNRFGKSYREANEV